MKLFTQVIVFLALVAVALSAVVPTPPSHCDYKCGGPDVPVYTSNGKCFLQFSNKCSMEKYNCLNPHKGFRLVSKDEYSADTAPRCQTKDY